MGLAINRESYFLHKVQSLTGIVPVGYYMAQHLVLNSFALAGPGYFNGVIGFFEGMPKFFLLTLEVFAIWLPLLFHAVYGLFIIGRSKVNYFEEKYGFSENRQYTLQRYSGIVIFFFLIYHTLTTTGQKYLTGNAEVIKFDAWHDKLTSYGYALTAVYAIGILASSYHLGYGIWNFCIRWGITVSDSAQRSMQKVSFAVFVGLTLVGWVALAGFLIHKKVGSTVEQASIVRPVHQIRLARA